ncbi:MAG: ATP-binding protein [Propionibacteriaceae bacterium]|nr:ATP-binding protein [Propionibacteriaceae bacterium]
MPGVLASEAGPNSLQLFRWMAVAVGAVAVGMTLVMGHSVVTLAGQAPLFWALMAVTLVLPLLLSGIAGYALWTSPSAAAALHGESRLADAACRVLLGLVLLGYAILALVSSFVAFLPVPAGTDVAPGDTPLLHYFMVMGIAAPAVLTGRASVVYVVVLTPLLMVSMAVSRGEFTMATAEQAPLFLAVILAQIGTLTWALDRAHDLDVALERRRQETTLLAVERARSRAMRSSFALIHDHVLSVLISVAGGLENSARLRQPARQALDRLDAKTPDATLKISSGLFAAITVCVAEVDSGIRVITHAEAEIPVDAEVGQALLAATLEAVRNSVRHAGEGVVRRVELASSSSRLRITVSDDGCGFSVPPQGAGRLGIGGSIVARLHDVGASVTIDSSPGRGTTVAIDWAAVAEQPKPAPVLGGAADSWPQSVSMETVGARVVGGYALIIHAVLALLELQAGAYRQPSPILISWLALGLAGYLLLRSWPEALIPNWACTTILVLMAISHLGNLWPINAHGWPGFSAWSSGGLALICYGLLMRQRPQVAWGGMAVLVATAGLWAMTTGRPLLLAFTLMLGHIVGLSLWHIVIWRCRIDIEKLVEIESRNAELQAERRAHEVSDMTMIRIVTAAKRRANPLLQQVASGGSLTAELRREAVLLEAELRDEARAPFFTDTPVVPAARAARERGVDVLLLDDRGAAAKLPEEARAKVIAQAVETLENAKGNRVVIRLSPPGRRELASFYADADRRVLLRDEAMA